MSKTREKGHKIVHRGLHALTPLKIMDHKTGDALPWDNVERDLKDLIRLENEIIQSYLNDPAWVERFTRTARAYQVNHDGRLPNGVIARKWAADNNLLIQVNKPKSWLASRLKEVFTRKMITEYGTWIVKDSQGKDQGDFELGRTLNPAFTDNKYSTLTYDPDGKTVILRLRVKDRDLDFYFQLPERR